MDSQLEALQDRVCAVNRRMIKAKQDLVAAKEAKNGEQIRSLFELLLSLDSQLLGLDEEQNVLLRTWQASMRSNSHSAYTTRVTYIGPPSGMGITKMRFEQGHAVASRSGDIQLHPTDPVYLNCRAAEPQVPIIVFHPVFAKFLRLARDCRPDAHSLKFTKKLVETAKWYLDNEVEDFIPVMHKMFQKYLVGVAGLGSVGDEYSSTDFSMQANNGLVMIAVCKLGLEEKAQPEGLNFYHKLWSRSFSNKLGQSFAPTFILELMGAGLRIGGAVWTHKVQYEPLTDVKNLLPLLGQESAMLGLACQLQALRECLSDLVAEHSPASPQLASGSNRLPLFAEGIPPHLHRFHEVRALPYPMLYRCRDSSSDVQMVAKFTTRYGMDVHRAWAAAGLAPRLLHTEVIDSADPMQLVIMDWLPETYCTLDQLPLDQLQSAAPAIQQALQSAHGILLNGQCFAHGDARLPNVRKARRQAVEGEVPGL
ncbi:hypothetical protein ABBQ38_003689 [Trebouxia sp. C0009 RCD-2024]